MARRRDTDKTCLDFHLNGDQLTEKSRPILKPKGDSNGLFLHALDNDNSPSNFISTTPDMNIATEFSTSYGSKDGYVYYTPDNNGININETLGADSPFTREEEITLLGGIIPNDVLGTTSVNMNDILENYTTLNPDRYETL